VCTIVTSEVSFINSSGACLCLSFSPSYHSLLIVESFLSSFLPNAISFTGRQTILINALCLYVSRVACTAGN
jgi:hypothetical protein